MRGRTGSSSTIAVAILSAVLALPVPMFAEEPAEAPAPPRGIFTGEEVLSGLAVVVDLIVVRPLGLTALGTGLALFVPAAALSASGGKATFLEAFEFFVEVPAKNVFTRRLGDL